MAISDGRSVDEPIVLTWRRSLGASELAEGGEGGGEVLVVGVRGDVDLATVQLLIDGLACVAAQQGDLVVDLCEVHFMDLNGVRALLGGHQELCTQGRLLVVACEPDGPVARILHLVAAHRPLAIESSRVTAVARAATGRRAAAAGAPPAGRPR